MLTVDDNDGHEAALRGERKVVALLRGSATAIASGKHLIRAGSDCRAVWRLVTGWAYQTRNLPDGRVHGVMLFMPGDLIAVESLWTGQSPDPITTCADCMLEHVDVRVLHRAARDDSDIAAYCLERLIEEKRRLEHWVGILGQATAEERLATLLVEVHARLARCGLIAPDAAAYPLPLTQLQLAALLGITAVHVNRVLKSLRERGIVAHRAGQVIVGNFVELRRAVQQMGIPQRVPSLTDRTRLTPVCMHRQRVADNSELMESRESSAFHP